MCVKKNLALTSTEKTNLLKRGLPPPPDNEMVAPLGRQATVDTPVIQWAFILNCTFFLQTQGVSVTIVMRSQ